MNKSSLPRIRLSAKPAGLTFKPPASAIARWDKTLHAVAKPETFAIDVMGEIGESGWNENFTTAAMVKAQLGAAGKAPVMVTVNSPGGDAFEGIAIYNLLREHPGAVTVNVLGLAASAASIIAMAGDVVQISEAAFLMIHSGWGVVMGNRNDMREFAAILEQLDTSVAGLYARRSGLPSDEILAMMEKETWMNGTEAVKLGFADVAIAEDKKKATAKSLFTNFQNFGGKSNAVKTVGLHPAAFITAATEQRPVVRLSISTSQPGPAPARRKGAVYL